jgi:hypothetical protein
VTNFKLAIVISALFTIRSGGECQPLHKIRIGYPSISSRQAQLWVAKDEGIFVSMGWMWS